MTGTKGEECCPNRSSPTSYVYVEGSVNAAVGAKIELSPYLWPIKYTFEGIGKIDGKCGCTFNVSQNLSGTIGVKGKFETSCGDYACREVFIDAGGNITVTLGGVFNLKIIIVDNWLWEGDEFELVDIAMVGQATTSMGSSISYKSSECPSPGLEFGCTYIGATDITGHICFAVFGLSYEYTTSPYRIFDGYNSCN
jgi:hypothetical protein